MWRHLSNIICFTRFWQDLISILFHQLICFTAVAASKGVFLLIQMHNRQWQVSSKKTWAYVLLLIQTIWQSLCHHSQVFTAHPLHVASRWLNKKKKIIIITGSTSNIFRWCIEKFTEAYSDTCSHLYSVKMTHDGISLWKRRRRPEVS